MTTAKQAARMSRAGTGARAGITLNDRYALEAKIGEGGMGEVWRAKHLALDNPVAIKFLTANVGASEAVQKRFLVEAKVTAQLKSRHAVQVFDFGVTTDGHPYLVMELLQGETLKARIGRLRRIDPESTVKILGAASKALARAHSLGIIHRDFKPDNVFLTKNEEGEDEVKVVDFGVAKLLGGMEEDPQTPTDEQIADAVTSLDSLTRTGRLVGTPHYMSPEQIRMSAELGPAADIWALGVVAFECLTGKHPFQGNNVLEVFAAIQLGQARSALELEPSLPKAFEKWFARACAVHAADRFPDAITATTALSEALLVGTRRSRDRGRASELETPLDLSVPSTLSSSTVGDKARKPGFPLWIVAGAATFAGGAIAVALTLRHDDLPPERVRAATTMTMSSSSTSLPSTAGSSSATSLPSEPSALPSANASVAPTSSTKPPSTPSARGTGAATSKAESTSAAGTTAPSAPPAPASATAKSPFTLPPLGL
ncbi:MAG: serine/threonine protein kinase [Myxococcaceae bacterium]|nr:serine/threonine protein kinase [Myxococcaceae bacterium]